MLKGNFNSLMALYAFLKTGNAVLLVLAAILRADIFEELAKELVENRMGWEALRVPIMNSFPISRMRSCKTNTQKLFSSTQIKELFVLS